MSRGSGYYEVENQRRLERQRQTVLGRVRQLQAAFEQASAAAAAVAETSGRARSASRLTSAPSESASTADLMAWVATAQPIIDKLNHQVAEMRARVAAADLARHLLAIASSGELATPYRRAVDLATAAGDPDGRDAEPSLEDLTEQIDRAVVHLDPDATHAEREQVEAAARAVLTRSTLEPNTLLTELKVLIKRVGIAASKRRADRKRARTLLESLDGVVGPEVDDLRRLLERVVAGDTPLVGVDEARVADARARAIAEEDRRYVADHLAAAFADLGYEVDSSFRNDLSAGEPAYAFLHDSPDHAAEIQLRAGRYSYRLVRTNASAARERDADYELSLCKAIGYVTAEAHEHGMTFLIDDYQPAGSEPLPYRPRARDKRQQGKTTTPDRLRERKG